MVYNVYIIVLLLLLCENTHVLSYMKCLQGTLRTHIILRNNIFARKTTVNNRIEKAHAGFVTQSL